MKQKLEPNGKIALITGAAGFIGAALTEKLLGCGFSKIVGIDNLNDYYSPSLKLNRLEKIKTADKENRFLFVKADISDKEELNSVFVEFKPSVVVNLAAQAGVRYSIVNPEAYIKSNIVGFFNVLEACRYFGIEHLVFASSSSVYGGNNKLPFSVSDKTDEPVSLYAATKKSDELLAYSYSQIYKIPTTALRFFTVYGPFGRPDMAYYSFAEKLGKGEKVSLFNNGECLRDFTFIDDVVEGVKRVVLSAPKFENDSAPYSVYNLGASAPVGLKEFFITLCEELARVGIIENGDFSAMCKLAPMQQGDVKATYADVSAFIKDFGFSPKVKLREGLGRFAEWYAKYNGFGKGGKR